MARSDDRGVRSLYVASAGGHLEELHLLSGSLGGSRSITWVTWDTPQTSALLRGERHVFIDYTPPHDPVATLRTFRAARRILDAEHFDEVVSTGALAAVPFMAVARSRNIACHYIESAARLSGPSLTGRLVGAMPGVRCYRQYPEWAKGSRFAYIGSVFDAFSPGPRVPRPIRRAVVSLGSSRFGFRRALELAKAALPPDCEVLWQNGSTDCSGLGITPAGMIAPALLREAIERADVVIAHAGVGTALLALGAGRCPVLLAREAARGEHVDDHQRMLAGHLAERRLALVPGRGGIDHSLLEEAAARSTAAQDPARGPLALRQWAS